MLFSPVGMSPKFTPDTEMAVDVAWAAMEDLVFAGKVFGGARECWAPCGNYPQKKERARVGLVLWTSGTGSVPWERTRLRGGPHHRREQHDEAADPDPPRAVPHPPRGRAAEVQ